MANGEAIAELQQELNFLRKRLSEFQCPYCKAGLIRSVGAPLDVEEKHWEVVRTFECGYEEFGGTKQRLCPIDPEFPKFAEYELIFRVEAPAGFGFWDTYYCEARPKTTSAGLVPLPCTLGTSKEEAAAEMERQYKERAKPWLRPMGIEP